MLDNIRRRRERPHQGAVNSIKIVAADVAPFRLDDAEWVGWIAGRSRLSTYETRLDFNVLPSHEPLHLEGVMKGLALFACTLPFLSGIDLAAAEPERKPDDLPVFIERNTTVTAYAFLPKVGDKGSRIFGSSIFVDPWLVARIESGEIFERQTWVSRFDWKNRRQSRITAVNIQSGERKTLVIRPQLAREVHFSVPEFVERRTIEMELRRGSGENSKGWVATYQWDLKTDEVRAMPARRKSPASIALLLRSAGLSLESLTEDGLSLKDRKTGQGLKLPLKETPSTVGGIFDNVPRVPRTMIGPGSSQARVIVYELPETWRATVSAYDPLGTRNPLWQLSAADVADRCSRERCAGVLPARNMRFPCESLPLLALFGNAPASLLVVREGAIEWTCEIRLKDPQYMVASENERFVAVQSHDRTPPYSLFFDCQSQSAFDPPPASEIATAFVKGISNGGDLVLTQVYWLFVCSYVDGAWKTKTLHLLDPPEAAQ